MNVYHYFSLTHSFIHSLSSQIHPSKMQNYKDAYAKFEAVLYGATEKGGITVEGAEIDAEMVSPM